VYKFTEDYSLAVSDFKQALELDPSFKCAADIEEIERLVRVPCCRLRRVLVFISPPFLPLHLLSTFVTLHIHNTTYTTLSFTFPSPFLSFSLARSFSLFLLLSFYLFFS